MQNDQDTPCPSDSTQWREAGNSKSNAAVFCEGMYQEVF